MLTMQHAPESPTAAYTSADLLREARSACRVWGLRYAGWTVRVGHDGATLVVTGTDRNGESIAIYHAL